MANLIDKFKPSLGQLHELLSSALRGTTNNSQVPSQLPIQDTQQASMADIRPITDLTNEERTSYQPEINEQIESSIPIDSVLRNLSQEQIQQGISEGKNLGSKTLDNIIKQMASSEAAKNNPEMAKTLGQETGAAQPIDEKKQLFDELIKKELKNLMGDTKSSITNPSDVINAFQKSQGGNIASGLTALSQYLGTSQGQDVLGGLMGMFGNKDMQIAYNRQGNRQRVLEEEQLKNSMLSEREKQKEISDIIQREMMATSPRGGASFKNTVDIAYAQGMIPKDKYEALIQTNDYMNDTFLPSATLNKLLEPYLINQRQGGAFGLAKEKHGYRMEEIGETAKKGEQKEKSVAEFKETLPSVSTETAKKQKELENLAGTSPISAVNAVKKQVNNFTKLFEVMPAQSKAISTLSRQISKQQTPSEVNFNAQRSLLFNKIARDLGGERGVLSDQDIKRIEEMMPTLYDKKSQKIAKMKAVQDLIDIRLEQYNQKIQLNQPTKIQSGQKIGRFEVIKVSE